MAKAKSGEEYEIRLADQPSVNEQWLEAAREWVAVNDAEAREAADYVLDRRLKHAFGVVRLGIYCRALRASRGLSMVAAAEMMRIPRRTLGNYVEVADKFLFLHEVTGLEALELIALPPGIPVFADGETEGELGDDAAAGVTKWRKFQNIKKGDRSKGFILQMFYNRFGITAEVKKRLGKAEEEVKALEASRFDIAKREAERIADDLEEIAGDTHPRARIEFMKDAVFYDFRLRVKKAAELLDVAAAKKVKRIS